MTIRISRNFTFRGILDSRLNRYERNLRRAAPRTVNTIRRRTLSGLDANGRPFRRYSPEYARTKAGLGGVGGVGGFNLSRPNLSLSGQMLQSITSAVSRVNNTLKLRLGFQGSRNARLALYHQTGDGVPQRKFFGLTPREKANLTNLIKQ